MKNSKNKQKTIRNTKKHRKCCKNTKTNNKRQKAAGIVHKDENNHNLLRNWKTKENWGIQFRAIPGKSGHQGQNATFAYIFITFWSFWSLLASLFRPKSGGGAQCLKLYSFCFFLSEMKVFWLFSMSLHRKRLFFSFLNIFYDFVYVLLFFMIFFDFCIYFLFFDSFQCVSIFFACF